MKTGAGGKGGNKVRSGDTASHRGSSRQPLRNKQKRGRGRAPPPGSRGGGTAAGQRRDLWRGWGRGPDASRVCEPVSPAPRPRGPGRTRVPGVLRASSPRSRRGADAVRRGLQVPGSLGAGAGRSLAQFPGIRRAGKRRGGRSGGGRRAASGERAGGRGAGGGGADVGRSPACQGGGWPGRRHNVVKICSVEREGEGGGRKREKAQR